MLLTTCCQRVKQEFLIVGIGDSAKYNFLRLRISAFFTKKRKELQVAVNDTYRSKHGMFHVPTVSSIFQVLIVFLPEPKLYSGIHVKCLASKIYSRISVVLAAAFFSLVHGMRILQMKPSRKIYEHIE